MATNYSLDQEAVSLPLLGFGLVIIFGLVGLALGVALYFNNVRQDQVVSQYTAETEEFVQTNRAALTQLFSTVMTACLNIEPPITPNTSLAQSYDCEAARTGLNNLQQSGVRDFSATAFLRYQNGRFEMIESSGRYHRPTVVHDSYVMNWDNRKDLELYLAEGKDLSLWQDFLTYVPGKEVIVPVELDNQVKGYIFRGVIER
jgi:hypothetical protein